MEIVCFGTFDEQAHPRVRVLREGLAAGHDVVVRNEPLGVDTAGRVSVASRPWLLPGLLLRLARSWVRLWRTSKGLAPDVGVVGYLGHADVHLARRRFPGAIVVLDHMVGLADTLADRRLGGGLLRSIAAAVDRAALRAADLVIVDTDAQAAQVAGRCRRPPVVVPVGAPAAWFAARRAHDAAGADDLADAAGDEPLRVVFFGLYTPLQGTPTVAAALAGLPAGTVAATLVGDGQDRAVVERLLAGSEGAVELVDWIAADDLPAVVAEHDVCLGIFGTTAKAGRVVPNKVYQGAAAGCAVITSDTPPQAKALHDAAVLVPPGDADALGAALRALAADRGRVRELQSAVAELADDAFRPEAVVAPLLAAVADGGAGVAARRADARLAPLTPNARLRWAEVRRHLERTAPRRILELGCGRGGFGARFARAATTYVGVEPDETSRAIAEAAVGDQTIVPDLADVDPAARFDWVCAFEVLEHIEHDEEALQGWVERLAPDGHLVLSVPGHQDRFGPADHMAGHFRRYEPEDLAALLGKVGLVDVDVRGYGAGAGYPLEWGRNLLARRQQTGDLDIAERTARSGRVLLLPSWLDAPTAVLMAPFTALQRPFGDRGIGPGLVAIGRRP